MLTLDECQAIEKAVKAAEAKTSAEIVCIYRRRVAGAGPIVRLLAAAGAALVAAPLGFLAHHGLADAWAAGELVDPALVRFEAVVEFILWQLGAFAAVYAAFSFAAVRRLVTPRSVKHARARRAALEAFLARGVHETEGRTGVLFYVVEEDHQIEIVPDSGVDDEVGHAAWAEVAATLGAGLKAKDPVKAFTAAIDLAAKHLAPHAPPRAEEKNELPNAVVVIDD